MKPRLFIGCSVESLSVGYAVQESLEHDADVTVWTQDVFKPSSTTIESIFQILKASDFGLFIMAPDDLSEIRGVNVKTTRDNVIFELGVFSGSLGPGKAFFLIPEDANDFHLPSDLLGITPLKYKSARENIHASVGPACNKLRKVLTAFGDKLRPIGSVAEAIIIVSANDGSSYAASRIRSAKLVRIVGTARQDVIEEVAEAAGYLHATEERVNSNTPFSYLRITSATLSSPFRQHLFRLLQAPKTKPGIRIEIAVEERMDASISYMIFDNDELLLIIDNTIFGSVRDNRLMVWCGENDIVKAFADHFDHAWNRLQNKCTTKAQLERVCSIKK
jgi:hypothetical protein